MLPTCIGHSVVSANKNAESMTDSFLTEVLIRALFLRQTPDPCAAEPHGGGKDAARPSDGALGFPLALSDTSGCDNRCEGLSVAMKRMFHISGD
jgi:hypothetical protein